MAIFHSILPRANTGCSVYWEIHLAKRAILKELVFSIPIYKNYIMFETVRKGHWLLKKHGDILNILAE